MKNTRHSGRSLKNIIAVLAVFTLPATAQPLLEEIVVTAQKREQSLQDVPISVVAVSGDQLESLNRNEITELAKTIAGFTFQTGSGDSERAVQIRGVGTSTFSKGVEQSVGTVIDGVVSSGVVASFLDFSDVERLEVLRGPQGMLFGKNASAGLLNIVTKRPTQELSFGLSASFADENEEKFTGYVSGGFSDAVSGRLSFYSNQRDSFIDNINQGVSGTYNNRDEWGVAGKLLIEPNDDLSLLLSIRHSERDYSCCYRPVIETNQGLIDLIVGFADPGNNAPPLPTGRENADIFDVTTFSPISAEVDIYSIELNYELGENTLTSITSYTETDFTANIAATGFPVTILADNLGDDQIEQITQELRITSPADRTVSYVAGLYYYKNELDRFQSQIFNPPFSRQPTTAGSEAISAVESNSLAVFGQATWNINALTRLSLGLRYNDEEVSMDQSVTSLLGAMRFPNPSRSTVVDDQAVSWRVIAERDFGSANMVYASAARGYKGPGANTLTTGLTAVKPIVGPEIPTNYEIGMKSEWLGGALRLNVSAFFTEFDDFQASLSDNNIPPAFFLSSAGKLETSGLEMELSAQATENLYISANLAAIDATFEQFQGAQCYPGQAVEDGCVGGQQDLSGRDLPFSPDLTVNLLARYDIGLDNLPFNAYVQGAYHWQDEVQFNTSNDPLTIHESYGIADFAIGIESNEGNYSAQVFVKNAFDEFYSSGFTTQGRSFGIILAQSLEYDYTRRVGVKFKLDF